MSKKSKTARKAKTHTQRPGESQELPAADSMTIFWMLCGVTTLLAEVANLAVLSYVWASGEPSMRLESIAMLLLMVAMVTGTISILLIPIVLQQSRTAPPKAIVRGMLIIGLLPWLAFFVQLGR
ncbi:hypothetical protein LOC68_00485 [Blastopirellula sp. JC732]|uniref:Uncharacterized protein n=1 Tax=Blastopirellula sediminis TaxID=2894196 RepID=A0A9X1MII5_9BACT|nr:hypothetical protein [Blastopirellula sediminis]MCC9604350.1 hypothetical protein [Blastopirellula sediminis]MCC9626870.1 hypothetical protein [Blastopirellula sediminis]